MMWSGLEEIGAFILSLYIVLSQQIFKSFALFGSV